MNLALGTNNNAKIIKTTISGLWYNDEFGNFPGYGIANPPLGNFEHWGHFSQIVWKATTTVGCWTQYCPNGLGNVGSDVAPYFTVCNYKPPGNVAGAYAKNIGKPKGEPTVTIAPKKNSN